MLREVMNPNANASAGASEGMMSELMMLRFLIEDASDKVMLH